MQYHLQRRPAVLIGSIRDESVLTPEYPAVTLAASAQAARHFFVGVQASSHSVAVLEWSAMRYVVACLAVCLSVISAAPAFA